MKNITFIPSSHEVEISVPPPEPAKNFIPQWYKDNKFFYPDNVPVFEKGDIANRSVKACAPFYDSLVSGYIQKTWCDIKIDIDGDRISYQYSRLPDIMSNRENSSIPVNSSMIDLEFIWKVHWIPKVENGYSILVTHPLNRFDLPFQTLSGIIDSDTFFHTNPGNMPFYLKWGFSGIIPAGTPMYQFIPIKRDSWKSNFEKFSFDNHLVRNTFMKTNFWGVYKKVFHTKKVYK